MSNPLRWFRKNAKVLMVVFGVGAMIIFGLGSVVSMINPSQLGGIRDDDNKRVIAEWDGGKVTKADVRRFTELHFQTQQFLANLQAYAAEQKGDNFRSDAMPIPPLTNSREFNEEEINQRVVIRMLLAEKAKREGILVNEQMVEDYLLMVAGEVPISLQEMRAIAKKTTGGRIELEHLVRHLKTELAAQQMQILSGTAMPLVPNPTEAFQYYVRTHKRAAAQVVPFDVKEYEAKVTEEPPVSELRRIYNEGKFDYPDPTGEKPGFKVGKKVRVQYLIADYEKFLAKEMAKLTDEEVQKEYERLVAEEDDLVMEVVPEESNEPADALPGEAGDGDAPKANADGNSNDEDDPAPKPGSTTDGDQGASSEGGAATEDESKSDSGDADNSDGEPESQEPTDEGQAVEPEGESSDGDRENDGGGEQAMSLSSAGNAYVSTSLLPQGQEEDEQKSGDTAPEVAGEGESDAAGSSGENTDQEDADPAPTPPASPENADAEKDMTGAPQGDAPSGEEEPQVVGPTIEDEPQIKKRPKPLAEVAEAIKRRMKAEAARNAIEKTLRKAESKIRYYQAQLDRWEMGQGSASGEKPESLDVQALAEELGLEFNETDLVDFQGLQQEPIGKIVTFMFGPDGRPVTQNVANMIFGQYHDTQLYEPRSVEDFATQSTYLYWLVEKVDQKVVSFDEAREKVVEFWRRQKAIELAKQDAEKLAEQVNQSGKTLKELREDAVETGEFSWFTSLGQVMYSTPMGVENAGEEFMQTVFNLEPGKAGVALNDTRDKVYVVQLTELDEVPVDELAREYLETQFFTFKRVPMDVSSVSNYYTEQINYEWMQELVKSLNVRWVGL